MVLEQVWAVVRKDAVLEFRSRTGITAMLFFAVIVLLTFSFALGRNPDQLKQTAGGLLWLAFIFSGILAFSRTYQIEAENNAFEGLILVASNPGAIYLGKLVGTALQMLLIEAVITPLMALLYNLDVWSRLPFLLPIALLGTTGFAAVGALYGALTMSMRAREVLLPLLLLPITVPIVLGAVTSTTAVLTGSDESIHLWIELLAAFDVIFVTAGTLMFEYVASE